MVICSLFLAEVPVPILGYSKTRGFFTQKLRIFKLFPVVIAIATAWLFCLILTAAGAFDEDSKARTDARSAVLSDSPWFRIPYPGQWGMPTVSVASVFGMLAGVLAGIVESIGDYYACANLCGAPPPPAHAVNRGIGVEGLSCLFAGSIGTGNGTTSFSENVGAIGITRVSIYMYFFVDRNFDRHARHYWIVLTNFFSNSFAG
ncbi:solute carrier family 23 member 2-like isoform X1 [Paramuricea clavata]|nr:solute carrier family 23 member 2-like isoform X1 [Paramuricea clavata]